MTLSRLPGRIARILLLAFIIFAVWGLCSCTPQLHSVKIENYTVSVGTCPVYQTVKHPRKFSKYLHPSNCNRAKKWEAPGIMAKPKKR